MADLQRGSSNLALPADLSAEILAKMQEQSAVQRLARQITMPGNGSAIHVVTSDPTAAWVAESAEGSASNSAVTTKVLRGYKLQVISTFSEELTRDAAALYDSLLGRLPGILARKFDNTVLNGTAPGSDFDVLTAATGVAITAGSTYGGLVSAVTGIANASYDANAFIIAPQAEALLLGEKDSTNRPLFIDNAQNGTIGSLLSRPVLKTPAAYKDDLIDKIGVVGDWSQAVWGTVGGVNVKVAREASIGDLDLFAAGMVAVKAEIEVGFRVSTTDAFRQLTA
jgi:HK97 family phage major capsid protein